MDYKKFYNMLKWNQDLITSIRGECKELTLFKDTPFHKLQVKLHPKQHKKELRYLAGTLGDIRGKMEAFLEETR